jgi:hypothetical protein
MGGAMKENIDASPLPVVPERPAALPAQVAAGEKVARPEFIAVPEIIERNKIGLPQGKSIQLDLFEELEKEKELFGRIGHKLNLKEYEGNIGLVDLTEPMRKALHALQTYLHDIGYAGMEKKDGEIEMAETAYFKLYGLEAKYEGDYAGYDKTTARRALLDLCTTPFMGWDEKRTAQGIIQQEVKIGTLGLLTYGRELLEKNGIRSETRRYFKISCPHEFMRRGIIDNAGKLLLGQRNAGTNVVYKPRNTLQEIRNLMSANPKLFDREAGGIGTTDKALAIPMRFTEYLAWSYTKKAGRREAIDRIGWEKLARHLTISDITITRNKKKAKELLVNCLKLAEALKYITRWSFEREIIEYEINEGRFYSPRADG